MTDVTISYEGTRVLLTIDGRTTSIPWEHADEMARGLRIKARQAEEIAKQEQITMDGAILFRSGSPFGFTNNRVIKDQIARFAQFDRDLRRFMPGGIKSREQFGTPTVVKDTP